MEESKKKEYPKEVGKTANLLRNPFTIKLLAKIVILPVIILGVDLTSSEFPEVYRGGLQKESGSWVAAGNLQENFRQVYKRVSPSVAFINTEKQRRRERNPLLEDPYFRRFFPNSRQQSIPRKSFGLGSGFVISSDGYIATSFHVIKDVDRINVEIEGEKYRARVIAVDPLGDIALLKVKTKKKLKPVRFADSDKVQVGDWALSIGNPFGLDRSLTVGVVSAVRRNVDELGSAYIQTDASINRGNSGGPLLNYRGQVIGINRFIFSNNPGGGNLGIGFAIPISEAAKILNSLKKDGQVKRGFIGIQMAPLSAQLIVDLDIPEKQGVYVNSVLKQSPAEKGGIIGGDVLLRVSNKKIKTPRDLVIFISGSPIGRKVEFTIWRDKKRILRNVEVGVRPQKF